MPRVHRTHKTQETAAEFLKHSTKNEAFSLFLYYCDEAGQIEPTKRQVRKYRNQRGAAYRASIGWSQDNHEANRK